MQQIEASVAKPPDAIKDAADTRATGPWRKRKTRGKGAFAELLAAVSAQPTRPSPIPGKTQATHHSDPRLGFRDEKGAQSTVRPGAVDPDGGNATRRASVRKKSGDPDEGRALSVERPNLVQDATKGSKSERGVETEAREGAARVSNEEQSRRSDEVPSIAVVDARARTAEDDASSVRRQAQHKQGERDPVRREHELTLDARFEPKGPDATRDGLPEAPSKAGESFAARFESQMRQAWSDEIVKTARIVLTGDESGTILLRLKPESLGDVKIELKLAENRITGTIVVSSDDAKSAFERSLASLKDAFAGNGFESAKLDVAVDQGGRERGDRGGREDGPKWSERLKSFDSASSTVAPARFARWAFASRGVDILA